MWAISASPGAAEFLLGDGPALLAPSDRLACTTTALFGRLDTVEDRACSNAVVVRLVTGCSWDTAAMLSPCGCQRPRCDAAGIPLGWAADTARRSPRDDGGGSLRFGAVRGYTPNTGGTEAAQRQSPVAGGRSARRGPWRRVGWHDATLTRPGWRCYYTTVGASLRQVPSPLWPAASGCWVASSASVMAGSVPSSTVTVAAALRKLLTRGMAPPLHPDAEAQLLALHTPSPAGLAVGDFATPPGGYPPYDMSLVESPAEQALVAWANQRHPGAVRWLIPQPPLDVLAAARGQRPAGDAQTSGRRCDFLLKILGSPPMVVEVDGSQHEQQRRVDARRDRLLEAAGVDVIRVPASEAFDGHGPQLDVLDARLRLEGSPGVSASAEVVWAAVQTHRLVLGLCEALAVGILAGQRWEVRLHDPTGLAAQLVGPYLELLDALDVMWGDRSIAPQEATFSSQGEVVHWRRESMCSYAREPTSTADVSGEGSVEIRLEPGAGPAVALPDDPSGPIVVVRSSRLPMPVHDQIDALPERRAAFAFATSDEAPEAVAQVMRAVFAVEGPREGQSEAVIEALSGRDCVVLLPTGAGKSMIYQLAGLCLPGRTLVIDPLVSLIEDQVESLARHGIDRAAGISAGKTKPDALEGAYFVFVSPERLQRQVFRDDLTEHNKTLPVNLAVIDEAHCVSEWGHDFRAAYLKFGYLLRRTCDGALGPPPLLALTGTASRAVLNDVMFQLEITSAGDNTLIRPASFDRPELSFEVVSAAPRSAAALLRGELRAMPARFGAPTASFYAPAGDDTFCGIVFTTTVWGSDRGLDTTIAEVKQLAPAAVRYAGRPPPGVSASAWQHEKTISTRAFKDNKAPVMVSTKAFGMGIDKPNVRWILHYGMPSSIEGYYQEAGRAGRDRRESHCVLVLVDSDPQQNRRLLADDSPVAAASQSRDDIGTALFFHARAFPSPGTELDNIIGVYDRLAAGNTTIPLGNSDGSNPEDGERALHRLAVLGIVNDYTLEGAYRTLAATVRLSDPSPQQIVDSLLMFIERSQPGRSAHMIKQIGLPHASARDAVSACGQALVDFVYDTIERSRRRSLREMWLIASSAAAQGGNAGGEAIRGRVLEYLTEGTATPVLLDLAERQQFAYSDWTPQWEQIASQSEAREWRAAAARLLVAYPDHPGLLASRAIADTLLADGDPADAENNLRRSYHQAADTYGATPADISAAARWTLTQLDHSDRAPVSPINGLVSAAHPTDAPVAVAAGAAVSVPALADNARRWLATRWARSDTLAAVYLTDRLRATTAAADIALARYLTRTSP